MLRRLAVAGDDLDTGRRARPDRPGRARRVRPARRRRWRPARSWSPSGRYRFRHDLVRRALAEQVPPHHRIAMHRDTARRLAERRRRPGADRPALARRRTAPTRRSPLAARGRPARGHGSAHSREALRHLDTLLEHEPAARRCAVPARRRPRRRSATAAHPPRTAWRPRSPGSRSPHEIRAKQALAQIKQGDPPGGRADAGGTRARDGRGPARARARAGPAPRCWASPIPRLGTAKAAESRRLALETGDRAVAGHRVLGPGRGRPRPRATCAASVERRPARDRVAARARRQRLRRAPVHHPAAALRRAPYPDVIAFADALRGRGRPARRRPRPRLRGDAARRGPAALRPAGRGGDGPARGRPAEPGELGGAVGEALALQRRAEVALYRGDQPDGDALLDEALAVARESDVGFHLLDRIYGTRINAAARPGRGAGRPRGRRERPSAARWRPAPAAGSPSPSRRPSPRPAPATSIGAAEWEPAAEMLADVVMRLPAWDAALRGGPGPPGAGDAASPPAAHFAAAAAGFRAAGQPLDEARCAPLADSLALTVIGNVPGTPGWQPPVRDPLRTCDAEGAQPCRPSPPTPSPSPSRTRPSRSA